MKSRRRTRITIISCILSFILMLSLLCGSILIFGKYSMLSMHGITYTCDRITYFEDASEEISLKAYQMGIPYGIKKKCLKDVFTAKTVRQDVLAMMEAQISGEKYVVKADEIREKITANVVDEYGQLKESEQESLDQYMVSVINLYQKKIEIPGATYIAKMVNIASKAAMIGIPICVLLIILCTFCLISMRRHYYRGLRYVAYGTLGAGFTLTTVFAASISNGFIYKFNISNAYMRKFFTFFIGHEMLIQVFSGIGMIIAGGVLIYMVFRQKRIVQDE